MAFFVLLLASGASAQTLVTPVISPVSGTYPSSQLVTITSTDSGVTLCYVVNGIPTSTDPGICGIGSTTYSGPFTITTSQSISALATKAGSTRSFVATNSYVITPPTTNSAYTNFCTSGSTNATTSGLNSSNLLLSAYTYCTVSVYATGTTNLIPLFSNATGTVLSNPFFASAVTGQYLFYGATGTVVDVTMSAGYPAPGIVTPTTLTGITLGGGSGGGGGGGITYCGAGVCVSSGSSWLTSLGIQGTDVNALTSGTITGTGSALCTDVNGGATTVGCLSGTLGGSVSPYFTPYSNATNQLVNSPDFWDSTGAATHTFNTTVKEVHNTSEADFIGVAGAAAAIGFKQGTAPTVLANNVQLAAPASVTGYNFLLPGAQAAGCLNNDGAGNGSWLANCGLDLQPQIIPPVSGQYVIIHPTLGGIVIAPSGCGNQTGSATATGSAEGATYTAFNCAGGADRSGIITFQDFPLPAGITAGQVTSVYFASTNSKEDTGKANFGGSGTCGSSPSFDNGNVTPNLPPTWIVDQYTTTSTGLTGSQLATAGCVFTFVGSADGTGGSSTFGLTSVVAIVYYTGSPIAPTSPLNIAPPLTYQIATNTLGIDPYAPFPGIDLNPQTVATALALQSGLPPGAAFWVVDGTSEADCSTGGSSGFPHFCYSTGGASLSTYITGTNVQINGGSTLPTANLNSTTPAAGTNGINVTWQNSGANVSAEIVGDGNTAHFLNGQGGFTVPAATTANALTMNNSGSGATSGTTFDGSVARTISYNTIGAAPLASPGFTGTPTAPTQSCASNTDIATGAYVSTCVPSLIPSQYKTWSCQPGYGDGLNAITAATYLQTECYNDSGVTRTITGISCYADTGSSTMAVTNSAGTALLTGAVTCGSSWAAGTQSATVTLANGDWLKFTFVADGTTTQSTFRVGGTQ